MKFSFSLERAAGQRVPSTDARTGAMITSPVALPGHAELLRRFQDANRRMFRSYDAAVTTDYNADFRSTFGSANAELLTSLYASRGRTRTLVKDFPQAKSIQRAFQNNVVGHDPFRLKMRVGKYVEDGDDAPRFVPDTRINRMIETEWEEFKRAENFTVRKDLSFMEALRIVEASLVRDGGILARHYRGFEGNPYFYAVDFLEADRLQESYTGRSAEGNMIRFSIERDRYNAPVAYWLLTRHPGDVFGWNSAQHMQQNFRERVSAADIIYLPNLRDRAEQDIGMTELDSIVQQLHRDRQYDIALTYAAIASCCKPFWIKKEFPTGIPYSPEQLEQMVNGGTLPGAEINPTQAQQQIGLRTNAMSPAMTESLPWGMTLQQLDPKFPIEAASEFKKDNMRSAAVGAGIAYQSVSGDFQNLGFSASRMSELPQRDYFKIRQQHIICGMVRRIFEEWLKYAILSGRLPGEWISRLEELRRAARFGARRWAYVNPLQDVQADILAVEAGFKSPQQVQADAEDGMPLDVLYSEIEEAHALEQAHGLDFAAAKAQTPGVEDADPDGGPAPAPGSAKADDNATPKPKKAGPNPLRFGIAPTTRTLLQLQATHGSNGH